MKNSRLRVDALTTGRNDPSARFRVRQYIEPRIIIENYSRRVVSEKIANTFSFFLSPSQLAR